MWVQMIQDRRRTDWANGLRRSLYPLFQRRRWLLSVWLGALIGLSWVTMHSSSSCWSDRTAYGNNSVAIQPLIRTPSVPELNDSTWP